MFVYGILLHWALTSSFKVCLLGIFVIVDACEIFIWVFTPWATLVMHLECRGFMWEFYEIGSWLICIRYEKWVIFLLGSPDQCLIHHSIIGDMTFLYCTNMGWSSFIPLSHCLLLYPITSFQIFVPSFIHSLDINTHYWFDIFFTHPFFCFAIDISFGYL